MSSVIDLAQYKYSLTLDSSEYSSGMSRAEAQAESMKTKLSGIGSFMQGALVAGLAVAAAAIGATLVEGVKATAQLDEQMSKFTAATGTTAEETAKIRDLAQELYKTNTDSMEDIVATSEAMVKQMGLTTDEVAKYQQSYLDYAKTTGQANTDVISAIDDIGDAWGLTAEDSVSSLDMLKASNEEYGTDIASVQSSLSSVAPAAQALGMSLEETNGIMNLFASTGLDAGQSVTAFTYAAKQVKSPEEFKSMLADIQAITDPTQKAQAAVELFGAKAGVSIANALDSSTNLDDFIVTMDEAAGTVTNASAAFDSNFNVQLELMKKQFSGLAQEVGEKFMPVLSNILSWVTSNMPNIMSTIEGAINFISGLIEPFITVIKNIVLSFQDTEGQTTSTFTAIQEVISSVIETVQTIVEAFVTLFTTVWEKWGADITSFAQTYFNDIMSVIQNALDLIQGIAQLFIDLFTGNWQGVFEDIKNIASTSWELIKSVFQTASDALGGIITAGFTLLGTIASGLMNALWTGIKDVWTNITAWFDEALFGDEGLITWFNSLGETFLNIGSSLLTWVFDGLKSVWEDIYSWVVEKVEWLADKLSFWNSGQDEMSGGNSDSGDSSTGVDGSHANGLAYVPFDNYTALLHRGERVLTAQENATYNRNRMTTSTTTNSTDNSTRINTVNVTTNESNLDIILKRAAMFSK